MDLDDIPLLRHLSLFVDVLKAAMMLAGLFLFPLMVLVKAYDFLRARPGPARWYFGLQTLAWACAADAYCLPMLAMLGNMFAHPAIGDGQAWLHLLSLFSDAAGFDLVFGEILLQAGLSATAFILSWCIGKEASNGRFVPHPYLRSKNDA